MRIFVFFILLLPSFLYSQSLKDCLGVEFGMTLKEASKAFNNGTYIGRTGQIKWDVNIKEIGAANSLLMFENKRLVSLLVSKPCLIGEASEVYNNCIKSFGGDKFLSNADVYNSGIGTSNEVSFNKDGVDVKVYLLKYGAGMFSVDIRTSIVINYYRPDVGK